MYAVFETGGKQYRVTEGDVVFLERLGGDPGNNVRFDKVLACSNEGAVDFGKPYLSDAEVEAKILGHGKDKKIVIFKYKAKKGYRRKQGHRQPYTKVRIERISASGYESVYREPEVSTLEDLAEDEIISPVTIDEEFGTDIDIGDTGVEVVDSDVDDDGGADIEIFDSEAEVFDSDVEIVDTGDGDDIEIDVSDVVDIDSYETVE